MAYTFNGNPISDSQAQQINQLKMLGQSGAISGAQASSALTSILTAAPSLADQINGLMGSDTGTTGTGASDGLSQQYDPLAVLQSQLAQQAQKEAEMKAQVETAPVAKTPVEQVLGVAASPIDNLLNLYKPGGIAQGIMGSFTGDQNAMNSGLDTAAYLRQNNLPVQWIGDLVAKFDPAAKAQNEMLSNRYKLNEYKNSLNQHVANTSAEKKLQAEKDQYLKSLGLSSLY